MKQYELYADFSNRDKAYQWIMPVFLRYLLLREKAPETLLNCIGNMLKSDPCANLFTLTAIALENDLLQSSLSEIHMKSEERLELMEYVIGNYLHPMEAKERNQTSSLQEAFLDTFAPKSPLTGERYLFFPLDIYYQLVNSKGTDCRLLTEEELGNLFDQVPAPLNENELSRPEKKSSYQDTAHEICSKNESNKEFTRQRIADYKKSNDQSGAFIDWPLAPFNTTIEDNQRIYFSIPSTLSPTEAGKAIQQLLSNRKTNKRDNTIPILKALQRTQALPFIDYCYANNLDYKSNASVKKFIESEYYSPSVNGVDFISEIFPIRRAGHSTSSIINLISSNQMHHLLLRHALNYQKTEKNFIVKY